MNCKQGDLAVIVLPKTSDKNLGKFVKVIGPSFKHELGWWFVESLSPAHIEGGRLDTKGHIEDRRLRPIRDPGDDAQDETLLWKPVPSTKETA